MSLHIMLQPLATPSISGPRSQVILGIILVAGKGHEAYQEIKGERLEFDDAKELKQNLQNKN